MGPTLGLFFRPYVEPAACPFALHPFLETDLYLLFVPFPSQFFLSVSVTPGWPGTSCLSPVSLSSQLACVYLSPPTHFSLAVSSHLLSYLPLPAIYFASYPLVFLSLIASLFSFFPFSLPTTCLSCGLDFLTNDLFIFPMPLSWLRPLTPQDPLG